MLRAVAGCIASDLPISTWFLLSITLLSLFIIVGKRKAELIYSDVSNSKTRPVLKKYSENLLIKLENLLATSTFITYSLWAAGPQLNGASSGWMILTVPFVLAGIFRYQLLSEIRNIESYKDKIKLTTEKPEEIILHDSGMKLIILGWLFITIIINFVS